MSMCARQVERMHACCETPCLMETCVGVARRKALTMLFSTTMVMGPPFPVVVRRWNVGSLSASGDTLSRGAETNAGVQPPNEFEMSS
jgi:hypothetical protein